MSVAIRTVGLTKDYGDGKGLFDLDLEVEAGEVLGYLGPNGAGKTTTIRLLMGMIHAGSGSAEVFGLDCSRQSVAVKRLVGYVPGELPQFGPLRGSEVVASIAGLRGGVDPARVEALCRRFDLDLGRRHREYSRGNKQKLAIVLAFMHEPRLLVLDEPTGGLDPLNQEGFHELCRQAREAGTTILLSSHILSEVEQASDRVAIVREGRLIRVAKLSDLHDIRFRRVELEVAGPPPLAAIAAAAGVDVVSAEGQRVRCSVRGSFAPLLQALAGTEVLSLSSHEPSLEEVFLAYYRPDSKS